MPTSLDRIAEAERSHAERVRSTLADAEVRVEQARVAAEARRRRAEAERDAAITARDRRIVAERVAKAAQIREQAARQAAFYDGVDSATVSALARWVVDQGTGRAS